VHTDGVDGIDNSGGRNILPLLTGLSPTVSVDYNDLIAQGDFTHIVRIESLGSGANYVNLAAPYYVGSDRGMPPLFDGSDVWPVAVELLNDPGDVTTSKIRFSESYVNQNVWVSGTPGTLPVLMVWNGGVMTLQVHHAIMSMRLSADRSTVDEGTISGILDPDELIAELQRIAGAISPSLCEATTFEGVANQMRKASDIMLDGSQNPSQTCNGISIGLGFDGAAIQLGGAAPPMAPPPDPCAG
jgi:hypothetical protein